MARSTIQRRQEAERARVAAYEVTLRQVSRRDRPPPDFETAISEAVRGFESEVVRAPSTWKPQMKTRDRARLRLAAARHLFARYPVAEHLEQIWLSFDGMTPDEIVLRKGWYVTAAGGGSLYKSGAGRWLSRKEVHAFVNPLARLGFDQAFFQAIARSYTSDAAIAHRIAHSAIARTPREELGFWREVVRFFCANATSVAEMNDFCDFLSDCHRRNPDFSLKGRTLGSLGRQMREWHRDLAEIMRIEALRVRAEAARNGRRGSAATASAWAGAALSDWSWVPSPKGGKDREVLLVVQLRTAADLVEETRAMHHCVSTYAAKCIAGQASIWSLRRRANGVTQRLLTIELDRQRRAVQIRGYANRRPYTDERRILERWAGSCGVLLAE